MRRSDSDDRVVTDPHGFTAVPAREEPVIPRQRTRRPSHDPWDPAHDPEPEEPRSGRPRYATRDDRPLPAGVPRDRGPRRRRPRRPEVGSGAQDGAAARRRTSHAPDRTRASRSRPGGTGTTVADPPAPGGMRIADVAVPVAIGSLVAVGIGVWARAQDPTGVAVNLAGFSSAGAVKTWLASLALVLAVAQGWTGMVLRGRVGTGPTALTATVHRWSGRLAVLVTVPVAVQCLIALGWSGATTRTLLHSLLGCVFYGAFVSKMLLLRRPGVPGWVVAVSGGALLAVLTGVWLTSALWFFGTHGPSF